MSRQVPYGMDVSWEAHEIEAFRIYNKLCGDQARAVFAYDRFQVGERPVIVPAPELAAIARKEARAN